MDIADALGRVRRPKRWPEIARAAALHAISLAATALTTAWARVAESRKGSVRAERLMRLRAEVALLIEELELKDARWARHPARRRPHYGPYERMRILQLRAARGWSLIQTAERFLVTEETIASWMRRLDEGGEAALVRMREPVNKFPEFVAYLVRTLKRLCPMLGKARIARMLAQTGLHLSATTVGRMLRARGPRDAVAVPSPLPHVRADRAKHPNHTWHLDLTTIPTRPGFWVPWMPFAIPQRWPFAWWVAFVLDHASRAVVGFAVYKTRPDSRDMCALLGRAIRSVGAKPRHVITDKGREFFCARFKRWCRRRGIGLRFGAVGKHGSVVVIERFIRSVKQECVRRILVPLQLDEMRRELALYGGWYNEHRPHEALGGSTPLEVYCHLPPANEQPRWEPRERWPRGAWCAGPKVRVRGKRGVRLELRVGYLHERRHLPVVGIKRAG